MMTSPPEGSRRAPVHSLEGTPAGPAFRKDLEVLPQQSGERPGFLVRDPSTGKAFTLGEREYFLCGQMDGRTPLPEVLERFARRFGTPLEPDELIAFLRLINQQGLLVPNGMPIVPDDIGTVPGAWLRSAPSTAVDAAFGWMADRLEPLFHPVGLGFSVGMLSLGAGVLAVHGGAYISEWGALIKGHFPYGLLLIAILFANLLQRFSTAIACKYAGGHVRWFGLRFIYYVIPSFRCDLSEAGLMWREKHRARTTWTVFLPQLLLCLVAIIGWNEAAGQTALREIFLVSSGVLLLLLPWNPFGVRNGYFLLSALTEQADLRKRSMNELWRWVFREPAYEPLTRRQQWGFRLFGLASLLCIGLIAGLIGYKILKLAINNIDIPGVTLIILAGLFAFEFEIRRFLKGFAPFYPFLARNDGRSTLAWTLRIGTIVLLVLVMFLPYPYEPGGSLRILPAKQVGIRTQVQGKIEEVFVKEGDWVKKGQIIARLDSRRTRKDLEVAEAELRRTKAQLALAEAGSKPEEIAKARESLATAEKDHFYASREAERLRKLFGEKVVSERLYEEALQRRDVSQGVLQTARENLNLVKSGARDEAIETQAAEVDSLEAQVKYLQEDLALSEIRSPIAGRIVKSPRLDMRVGVEVIVGDLIASVQDDRSLLAEVEVPEKNVGDIKPGARVKVKTWSYPDLTFEGKVRNVAPVVTDKAKEGTVEYLRTEREDALSRATTSDEGRVVRVLVDIPNDDGLLKSEMTGYGKVFTKYEPFGLVMTHGLVRFFTVEVWSWIP